MQAFPLQQVHGLTSRDVVAAVSSKLVLGAVASSALAWL